MKKIQLMMTKNKALFADIIPAGISLIAVLGFFASKLLSNQRLNAIAALLAVTMQMMTKINFNALPQKTTLVMSCPQSIELFKLYCLYWKMPIKNPINAKGIAKIVCENLTNER